LVKQSLYYIYKINSSKLQKADYNIQDLTPEKARYNGELISVGDNQVFRFIRKLHRKDADNTKVQLKLSKLYKQREELRANHDLTDKAKKKEMLKIKKNIDDLLLVKDIINVKVDNKKTYKEITKNGFVVNGIRYVRLCCGAGQARRNTVSFVNQTIFPILYNMLMNGASISKMNLAKYNAYFGLYMSSTLQVKTPRVCLINDCEMKLFNKKVDYIVDKVDDNGVEYRDIEERIINPKMNLWDGQGLISPEFADRWSNDLQLDYTASQFIIRSAFIKGMLTVFDFKKFAKEVAMTNKIKDYYGKEWDIDKIDVILSISQFKMYKYYTSWEHYMECCKKYDHIWGVARVNAKKDNEYGLLNYQYIQTLDLDKEQIQELAQPTIDWIQKVCNGDDRLYNLLFLLGTSDKNTKLEDVINRTGSNFVKAIIYKDELQNDPYVKKKIYNNIERKIKDAKLGRLWVKGNYQIMVSDPYAQAEFAFGLPVRGLLKEGQHWSSFWQKQGISKVDACRSPMVDFHEHNILDIVQDDSIAEWYKHMQSGVVYNVWGLDTIRHSDSDFDGDIIFTTNNPIVLQGIVPNLNPITYDKTTAPAQKLTLSNIIKTDVASFDCKVGVVTNYSTAFISMLAKFKKGSSEYNELLKRIKLLRRYIGDSIDAAKGIKMKPFPVSWKKRLKVNESDSDEVKQNKYYHNSLVANKKPYFMIYLYNKLMADFGNYKKTKNLFAKENLFKNTKSIINEVDKTQEEKKFLRNYYNHMPVLQSSCVMNNLCRIIEGVDFKLKYPHNNKNNEISHSILQRTNVELDPVKLKQLESIYNKFMVNKSRKISNINVDSDDSELSDIYQEEDNSIITNVYDIFRNETQSIFEDPQELSDYAVELCYKLYQNKDKLFLWSICEEGLMKTITEKPDNTIYIPVRYDDGTEYLGNRFILGRIDSHNNI